MHCSYMVIAEYFLSLYRVQHKVIFSWDCWVHKCPMVLEVPLSRASAESDENAPLPRHAVAEASVIFRLSGPLAGEPGGRGAISLRRGLLLPLVPALRRGVGRPQTNAHTRVHTRTRTHACGVKIAGSVRNGPVPQLAPTLSPSRSARCLQLPFYFYRNILLFASQFGPGQAPASRCCSNEKSTAILPFFFN